MSCKAHACTNPWQLRMDKKLQKVGAGHVTSRTTEEVGNSAIFWDYGFQTDRDTPSPFGYYCA